ncbi:MAG: hypothetical protein JWQ49_4487 [Edaphobacter sp.]|nr:hypothetical protein [Edaphobacter sp.]
MAHQNEFNVSDLLIVYEELLNLLQDHWLEIRQIMDTRVKDRSLGNSDDPIISHLLLPSTSLIRQTRTHKARVYLTPRKGRFVTENENIEGISVVGAGFWEETEIIWKYHPFRHDLGQLHPPSPFVELVFISAAPRRFDDDLHGIPLGAKVHGLVLINGMSESFESERLLPMKTPARHFIPEVPSRQSRVEMTIGIDVEAA